MEAIKTIILISILSFYLCGQTNEPVKVKVLTLGVFHFDYPNLDAIKVEDKDKISVLDEPYQTDIKNITDALAKFKPTIIAVESLPENQQKIDSLYSLFKSGKWELKKNEIYQLGFRLGKILDLEKIYCIDDMGRHYENIEQIFKDSIRLVKLENYYFNSTDSIYFKRNRSDKIKNLTDALILSNNPDNIKGRLGIYLLNPFKYEEKPGDFSGVDFETGRWFSRNLRIFRNIQRIPQTSDDRILLIIGSEHLNLLNHFFEASKEYELISPLPFLVEAKVSK